jgi:hypothetical protein
MRRNNKRSKSGKSNVKKKKKEDNDIDVTEEEAVGEEGEEMVDGQYVVESVVDKRRRNNRVEYLIKWLNYSDKDNTWERMAQPFFNIYIKLIFFNN